MTAQREYPHLPEVHRDPTVLAVLRAVNKILAGRGNNCGLFNLAASPATTTTVLNNRMEATKCVFLSPMNAAAAHCDAYISARANGSFVVSHLASLSTASFMYTMLGGNEL